MPGQAGRSPSPWHVSIVAGQIREYFGCPPRCGVNSHFVNIWIWYFRNPNYHDTYGTDLIYYKLYVAFFIFILVGLYKAINIDIYSIGGRI